MTFITLIALIAVAGALWRRIADLRERVGELERAAAWATRDDAAPVLRIEPSPSIGTDNPVEGRGDLAGSTTAPPRAVARIVHPMPAMSQPDPPRRTPPGLVEPTFQQGPAAAAEAEPLPLTAAEPTPRIGFEDIFGRKLPIWAGGITLAVCGLLIVRYSIDAGLLSPFVRIVGGLLFGVGLIAGAEAALRHDDRVRDPRVRQALAGAGIATLYGSILVAVNVYHLVGPLPAFIGLAAVTLLAALLSIRFGAPSAILGLVGGLAAPALVGAGEPNVPLLAFYLSLTVGGLATLGRGQRWPWLGVAALTGGFGWGLVLLVAGALDTAASLAIGLYLLLLGIALPALLFRETRGLLVRLGGAAAATAQLALLVATGGFAPLHWGLFALLSAAVIWLSRREEKLADLPALGLATALLLMAIWPRPTPGMVALVLGGAAALYGGATLWRIWRSDGRESDAGMIAALAVAAVALPLWHFTPIVGQGETGLALLGAALTGGAATLGWRVPSRGEDFRFPLLVGTAAALLATAVALGAPGYLVAPGWAAIAAALLLFAGVAADRRIAATAWLVGALSLPALLADPFRSQTPLLAAAGLGDDVSIGEALRWAFIGAVAALFGVRTRISGLRHASAATATLLGYVGLAQVTPTALLPLWPAIGLAALGWWRRSDAATITAATLAAAWAMAPVGQWSIAAVGAMVAMPLFVGTVPLPGDVATHLLAPVAALALLAWHEPDGPRRRGMIAVAGVLGTVAAHSLWKQVFAIADIESLVRLGMAERTVWEAVLALAAVALRRRLPRVALALGAASLAHFAWFTLLLHNPLWSEQAVGPLPIANLLVLAYGIAAALLWAAGREALPAVVERARQIALMAVALLFALSELRQFAHGSLLANGDLTQAEDIARSIVAILLAIGFLQWGIRKPDRDWRIASLLLMLAAVVKVFLFDTSGLDGLLRIGSFAALGFSLIGIGWLYSRYLPADADR